MCAKRLEMRDLFVEIQEQLKTVFPTLVGMLIYRMPWLISLRFVGGIGEDELAAAAFANSLCNMTGMALSVGLSSAMTTLTAQSRGHLQARQQSTEEKSDNNNGEIELASLLNEGEDPVTSQAVEEGVPAPPSKSEEQQQLLPLVYLYRGLFIQLLFVVPISCWWLYGVKPVLMLLGLGEKLSTMTEVYLRILTPGLLSYSINWTLVSWLQAIEMSDVPPYAAAVGLALHIPANYFFMNTLGFGYLGCAVATVMFQFIQPLQLITYLFFTRKGSQLTLERMNASAVGRSELSLWKELKTAVFSLSGILQYLSLAVPGIVVMSEWWASELSVVLSGGLTPSSELALGAMTIFQSMNTFCFTFGIAFSVAGAVRVGKLLGANDAQGAAFASKVTILCTAIVSGLIATVLFFTPHTFFPSIFAPTSDELVLETSRLVPLLSLYIFADALACAFNGIIKGCGRQVVTMPVILIAYWVVGVPLAYYMAFVRHNGVLTCDDGSYFCGDVGLVLGMTTGTWLHMFLLGAVVLGCTNWEGQARKARERLSGSS
jgi:MATE family multidrug resistance protein